MRCVRTGATTVEDGRGGIKASGAGGIEASVWRQLLATVISGQLDEK